MAEDCSEIRLPRRVYEQIESSVVAMYKECNITEVPVAPREILAQKGYLLASKNMATSPVLRKLFDTNTDGISCFNKVKGTYIICVNPKQGEERCRFTIMHELGHISLGHKEESELANIMANYFAAYALAPSPLIKLFGCEDYIDIVERFGVSPPCADICFQRYSNWLQYGGALKSYEKELLCLFGQSTA